MGCSRDYLLWEIALDVDLWLAALGRSGGDPLVVDASEVPMHLYRYTGCSSLYTRREYIGYTGVCMVYRMQRDTLLHT